MGQFLRGIPPAILQRCPRCRRGPVYRRFIWMHEDCPVCGLHFEREHGYFTGAMYVSYALGIVATAPLYFAMLLLGMSGATILAITTAVVAVLFPLLFRYSRVLWMYLDHGFNPVEQAGTATAERAANLPTKRPPESDERPFPVP